MQTEALLILLLVLATSVAIATRSLKVPYTVALVAAGLILGSLDLIEAPALTREILFFAFLPGLLFEAAYHLEWDEFRRHLLPIGSLAVPGVAIATVLTALVLTPAVDVLDLADGFGWRIGLVFGALIAATDPIAVVALFKAVGAPRELSVLMEGESLINDGIAIVLFTLALSVATGDSVAPAHLILDFFSTVGGGAALGVGIGLGISAVVMRVDDPMIEITLTTIAAYGSFVAAERLGFSGVIATVSAGMLCGNYAASEGMTPSTRIAVESFWEYVAFALNSLVFLLIGFEVEITSLVQAWLPIVVAYVAVLVSRGFVAASVAALLRMRGRPIPWSWSAVLWWGGLRGGISMVLALSLAPSFPNRDLLVTMTFGVVTLVILVHGFTLSPVLELLGLARRQEARDAFELARGRLHVAQRALDVVKGLASSRATDPQLLEELQEEYEGRLEHAEERLRDLHLEDPDLRASEVSRLLRQILLAERRQATEGYRTGLLSRDVYKRLAGDIDARLTQVDEGLHPSEDGEGEEPLERAKELASGVLAEEDSESAPRPETEVLPESDGRKESAVAPDEEPG